MAKYEKYYIDMDVTVSVRMNIDAKSESDARMIALGNIERDTTHYLRNSAYVGAVIIECNKE